MDKLLHLAGYALLSILFLRAYLNASRLTRRPMLAMLCAFFSAALYGVSDELHQSLVSARQAEVLDLVADTIGSAMGVGGYWVANNFLGIAKARQVE
jgi:VanZ family protein